MALPDTFRSDGFDFTQLAREGDVVLLRKMKRNIETLEVVIVQKMEEHRWPNGDVTPAHEHMPKSELWGTAGWSLITLERAWQKFRELVEREPAEQKT